MWALVIDSEIASLHPTRDAAAIERRRVEAPCWISRCRAGAKPGDRWTFADALILAGLSRGERRPVQGPAAVEISREHGERDHR